MKNLNRTRGLPESPMCTPRAACAGRSRGFSLLELLVAMAVLAVLGVLIVQMTSATGRTIRVSNRLVGAASQARLAFDRIGLDLGALVKRADADFVAVNPPVVGDDAMRFLSEITSKGGDRKLSLVAYRVKAHPDNQDANNADRVCLLRAGMPISWDYATSFMGLRNDGLPVQLSASGLLPAATDFDVLAPGVLRMVVGFQLYPDNQSATLQDGTSIANALGQVVYSPPVRPAPAAAYIDLSRISAIVVGLVAVDADSLKLLTAGEAAALSSQFDVPSAGEMPVAKWSPVINNIISAGATSPPLSVRQALRVYQRVYPINPFGEHSL